MRVADVEQYQGGVSVFLNVVEEIYRVPPLPSSLRAPAPGRFSPRIGRILRFRGEKTEFFVFPQLK
jgi:hypothetical protein